MSRPSDWRERVLGRDPRYSYIVQAPAGSGKTELLTQRMLGLLARVENPEEVVAITFTRKAAAEMSHRLVSRLQAAAQNNDGLNVGLNDNGKLQEHELISQELALAVLENDAERGWNLLEQPSRLRIRTIDSLCSELARQLPVLSGLGGGHQVSVDADALYRKAAMRTMAVIEDDGDELQADVIRVLDRYDNQYDKLVNLLTSMLGSREQWLGHLVNARLGNGFDRHGLEDSLRYLIEIQLKAARDHTPGSLFDELPRFYNYALANSPADEAELRALLEASGGFDCEFLNLPTTADALVHWKTMIRRLLTADGKKWRAGADARAGFPAPSGARGEEKALRKTWKDDFRELLDEYRENDDLREIYSTICTLPRPDYEDEAWESLESLMRLLLRAAEEWGLVLAETGEVDFSEIASRAIQSLGFAEAPSDLALRMDYRIQHLLVDEFQDTSHKQVELLNKLTAGWSDGDGRTLFLVGDPMQSIYRFRKAEVSLFIKAWQGQLFDHIKLIPLQLRVNFRSNEPIVDWVNQTFPAVMPRQNDPVMGAVSYSEASTRPGVSDSGTVSTRILPQRDDEQEARQVIEVIRKCDENETVAILVRSRNHASEILAALDSLKEEHARFRYQAINFNPLAETPLIQDLVSLTLALLQPADRLAWLATLRAPFAGLDLADLDELVAGNPNDIILDAIGATGGTSKQSRLQRIGPILLEAADRRGRQSVRSLIESTWIKLGGPACVENASELDDAATYFGLLESLEDENLPIDRDTLDQRMENLYAEPDASANGNLQVITIYAAKGLQFNTVILPGLNRAPAGDKNKLLHWFELFGEDGPARGDRIVMSPMRNNADKEKQKKSGDLIEFISNIEKQRQGLEDGRLLYVAATRAIHSLYLFAAIKPNSGDEIKADSRSLLGSLWAAIQSEQAPLIRQAAENLRAKEEDEALEEIPVFTLPQEYRRLGPDWRLPCAPESVQLARTESGAEPGAEPGVEPGVGLAQSHDYIEFKWAGEDARLTGNLVHRLLQLIGDEGLESWEAGGGISKRENWCRQQLASEGVREQKADRIIARATRAINNCQASEHGKWILESREESHCEYAITAVLDGQAKKMVLDRTFIENGTRWIIDYKTSSHSGGDLEGFLKNEAGRYRDQLQGYKNAVAITETRPIRTALYFPLLDRFCEL
jgi:ATP-dependent helicase/nuclease subunit A